MGEFHGWKELCADINWIDHGGTWAKKDPGRSRTWFVLIFSNMEDCIGKEAPYKYECVVKLINMSLIPTDKIREAIKSCSDTEQWLEVGNKFFFTPDSPNSVSEEETDMMLVEACISYGLGAPIKTITGDKYPTRLRAETKRYVESCIQDDNLLQRALDTPVNAIGSTAREYGVGDLDSALHRGPFTPQNNSL